MNKIKIFLYSLKRSLFDPSYYQHIKKASFWFSFKYLFFLMLLLTLIKSIQFVGGYLFFRPQIRPGIDSLIRYGKNAYPKDLTLVMRNGKLSTNLKKPYVLTVAGMPKRFLVIDTKGSLDNYVHYDTYILATKNAIIYPSQSRGGKMSETGIFYFNEIKNDFVVNRKIYDQVFNKVLPYAKKAVFFADIIFLSFFALFLIFTPILMMSGVMIFLVFLTFIVWIVSLLFKKGNRYGTLYKMGMHAVAWPTLFGEITSYLRIRIPGLYFVVFFVFMMIVLFYDKKTLKTKKML